MFRGLLILLLLLCGAAVGGVAWIAMTPADAPAVAEAPPPPARGAFLVAARPVRAGVLLRTEDLAVAEMDLAAAPEGAQRDLPAVRTELLGAMVRRGLSQGEAVRPADLLRPGDRGFLAAILGPDMRAYAVAVDVVTGAAGLIWPGDRVDLLLTQQLNDEASPAWRRTFGETVLTDVRVIAVDRAIMQGAVGENPEPNRESRTVTLEVTARQAEVAAVATRLGRLSLLLRSAADPGPDAVASPASREPLVRPIADAPPRPPRPADEPGVVWGGDVSPGLRAGRPDSAPPRSVHVFTGGARREEFRF